MRLNINNPYQAHDTISDLLTEAFGIAEYYEISLTDALQVQANMLASISKRGRKPKPKGGKISFYEGGWDGKGLEPWDNKKTKYDADKRPATAYH
jgi:hypothetical protein